MTARSQNRFGALVVESTADNSPATIARLGSHNGAKFSQWCTRIHADTPRAQGHGCARCVRGESVDAAEMARRFGLSGAHLLRGLLGCRSGQATRTTYSRSAARISQPALPDVRAR